jgi:hypothetical protein
MIVLCEREFDDFILCMSYQKINNTMAGSSVSSLDRVVRFYEALENGTMIPGRMR